MKLDPDTQRRGRNWLLGAGGLAVLFSFFLYNVDLTLTDSPRERILGETLYELRMSQHSLPTGETDERLTTSPFDSAEEAATEHEDHNEDSHH